MNSSKGSKDENYNLARAVAVTGIFAALSNAVSFLAIPGPLNIQFGLTAIPFLIVSFYLGPRWGFLCGLLGGVVQAQKYGHLAYILYTAIQGGVAGYFAQRPSHARASAPLVLFFAGFFLLWWIDLLATSPHRLTDLATSFADAPKLFGMTIDWVFPVYAILGGVIGLAIAIWVARREIEHGSFVHLLLAGTFGAVAYIPYDALVLYQLQGYPWLPTWFVLSKDLFQDFVAAALVASLYRVPRIQGLLNAR